MPAEDDYAKYRAIAEELSEDEEEREEFLEQVRARRGYKKITLWGDPEPEEPSGDGKPKPSLLRKPADKTPPGKGGQY